MVAEPQDRAGLTAAEAASLLALHGPNELTAARRPPLILRLLKPLADPMAVLLVVASVTYALLGDRFDATVTGVALVPIVLVTVILEGRAERALERLKRLTSPTATVIRDGVRATIPSAEVVPGDLLVVQEGDLLPADGTLVDGSQLMVDESLLTGESQPVTKDADDSNGERAVYAGTTLLSGRGLVAVTATGMRTRHGAIGALLSEIEQPRTPLQRVVERFVKQLGVVALVFCTVVVAVDVLRGRGWPAAVIAGVSLAMAAIPEEFPMVYTLYLALGAWRLARDNALIRRLASAETLGATTVICTDKTGTLTYGRLEVGAVVPLGGEVTPSGALPLSPEAERVVEGAFLASESAPFDPLEQAVERFAAGAVLGHDAWRAARLVRRYAFDPAAKLVSYVRERDGQAFLYAKGAVEGITARSRLSSAQRGQIEEANRALASAGMRVIAVAGRALPQAGDRETDESALDFFGLLAFSDPVRPNVRGSLEECRRAGVRVIMLTGDHPETARHVAATLGFPLDGGSAVSSGDRIDALDDAALAEMVAHTTVFARMRPEQKYRLVRALQSRGEVVAMTGDGTNDAPALREADIGVAMGKRGTEVAREAADLVLLDDDFTTIERAVRDGRRIFDNLMHAFSYLLAFHVPLLLSALVLPILGAPLLLLPVHLVWLELIVHPTASLVFEADPADAELMTRPPRTRTNGLIGRVAALRPLVSGTVLAAAVIAFYLVALAGGMREPEARAAALATMIVGQLLLVLVERDPLRPVWRTSLTANPTLLLVVALSLASVVAAVQIPAVNQLVELAPLDATQWLIAVALAAAATLWYEPVKAFRAVP